MAKIDSIAILFKELINTFGITELSDRLQQSKKTIGHLAKNGDADIITFFDIVKKCNIPLHDLMNKGKLIDLQAVINYLKYGEDSTYIPTRYQIDAGTKKRTIINILAFAEIFGHDISSPLSHIQCTKKSFTEDPEGKVSVMLCNDLFNYLDQFHFKNKKMFFNAGQFSFATISKSPLKHIMTSQKSPKQLVETIIEEHTDKFDTNYNYKITKSSITGCVIESTQAEHICEALHVNTFGSEKMCNLRAGVFSSFNYFQKLPLADVKETKCIHNGDDFCRFEINYN